LVEILGTLVLEVIMKEYLEREGAEGGHLMRLAMARER
jgi:hypothetical protein